MTLLVWKRFDKLFCKTRFPSVLGLFCGIVPPCITSVHGPGLDHFRQFGPVMEDDSFIRPNGDVMQVRFKNRVDAEACRLGLNNRYIGSPSVTCPPFPVLSLFLLFFLDHEIVIHATYAPVSRRLVPSACWLGGPYYYQKLCTCSGTLVSIPPVHRLFVPPCTS